MFGFTSVMTGAMSPPLDCCAVTDTICWADGDQPITGRDRRGLTNQRPGQAALPSDPGSHIRRGWRPMSSYVMPDCNDCVWIAENGNHDLRILLSDVLWK